MPSARLGVSPRTLHARDTVSNGQVTLDTRPEAQGLRGSGPGGCGPAHLPGQSLTFPQCRHLPSWRRRCTQWCRTKVGWWRKREHHWSEGWRGARPERGRHAQHASEVWGCSRKLSEACVRESGWRLLSMASRWGQKSKEAQEAGGASPSLQVGPATPSPSRPSLSLSPAPPWAPE